MPVKKVNFAESENPTRDAIASVDPSVLALLPADYQGTSENADLVALFVKTLNKIGSYDELNTIDTTSIPEDMRRGNARKFANTYLRFVRNGSDFGIYYDFQSIFQSGEFLSSDEIFYSVRLIEHYGDKTRNGILNTLNGILEYKVNTLGEPRELVTINQLENLFALSNILRSEGIQVKIGYLWVCSTHWSAEEVIEMIAEGLELRKAVELYTMGFTSMAEIIEYGDSIPDSWLDRIINGPPPKNPDEA